MPEISKPQQTTEMNDLTESERRELLNEFFEDQIKPNNTEKQTKTMRYCVDCKHLGIRNQCLYRYICPVTGEVQLETCASLRRESELYCGRDARHFEPAEEEILSIGCSVSRFVSKLQANIKNLRIEGQPVHAMATDNEGFSITTESNRYYFLYLMTEVALRSALDTDCALKLSDDKYGVRHIACVHPVTGAYMTLKDIVTSFTK